MSSSGQVFIERGNPGLPPMSLRRLSRARAFPLLLAALLAWLQQDNEQLMHDRLSMILLQQNICVSACRNYHMSQM